MKRLFWGILAVIMLVMSGCGDASISVVIPIVPLINGPIITSYQSTQDPATEVIRGSVDFFALDSDIDTIDIAVFDSRGNIVSNTITKLDLPGVIRGRVPFIINYFTYPAGTFTFSIILTNFYGNTDEIVDTFSIP